MPKMYNLRELVLKVLEKKELSRKKLLEEVRWKLDTRVSDKTLNETLMHLLREKKIDITDYDFDVYGEVRRIQSIRADGIVFSLLKTDPIEISILLKQLESKDLDEVKDASYKLKRVFKRKIREIEEYKEQEWEKLKKKVVYKPLDIFLNELGDDPENENLKKELLEIHNKFENARIWFLSDRTMEPKRSLKPMAKIDEDGSMTEEEFLKYCDHKITKKMNIQDVNSLFNKIVYFINSQKQDQKRILMQKLAWGLSSEKGSIQLLEDLINYIDSQTIHED